MRNTTATNSNVYVLESELNMYEFNPAYPSKPKTIGEIIRKARMDKGLQEKELARLAGVTASTVGNWEIYGKIPRLEYYRKLKNVLPVDISPEMLYKDYPVNPVALNQKIKQKRLNLHLSQRELAEQLGLCVDTLRDWEAGRALKKPFESSKEKIKNFLDKKHTVVYNRMYG